MEKFINELTLLRPVRRKAIYCYAAIAYRHIATNVPIAEDISLLTEECAIVSMAMASYAMNV